MTGIRPDPIDHPAVRRCHGDDGAPVDGRDHTWCEPETAVS